MGETFTYEEKFTKIEDEMGYINCNPTTVEAKDICEQLKIKSDNWSKIEFVKHFRLECKKRYGYPCELKEALVRVNEFLY